MRDKKQIKPPYGLWLLTFLTLISFLLVYASYQNQISEVEILEEQLTKTTCQVGETKFNCIDRAREYLPYPSSVSAVIIGLLFVATLVLAIYQTIIYFVESRKPADKDFLKVIIGKKHSQDLLGEMYQISYLYNHESITPSVSYLVGILEECTHRISNFYNISPLGKPGDGPIAFSPTKHIPYGHIMLDDRVWISQVGWEQDERILLPSMVSKDRDLYLKGDWS